MIVNPKKQADYDFFKSEIQQCLDNIEHFASYGDWGMVCCWQQQQMMWEDNIQKYVDIMGDWA